MDWFKRKDKKIKEKNKKAIPDGLWDKCPSCKEILFKPELDKNLSVCRHCDFHFRMNFRYYLEFAASLAIKSTSLFNLSIE